MKVLMLSDVYFPRVNGVSTSIQTFASALPEHGIEVDIIAPEYPQNTAAFSSESVMRLPSRYLPFDPEDRLMHWHPLKRQLASLHGKGYDLIHLQTPFVAHYAGLRLARDLNLPTVTTYHTLFEEYLHLYLPLLPTRISKWLARRISRSQCNQTDGVIAPSILMRDTLQRYGVNTPIEVIPTGIPLQDFGAADGAAFRIKHNIGADRQVALFVGRVAFEKNIPLLIHAMARLRSRLPRALLLIAGEGPAQESLESLVKSLGLGQHVRFMGYMDRQRDLPAAYACAEVFAFSSVTETQGLVLLEAMASGLPVVGIPAMGARDILGPERGCLCARNEAVDFADKLACLLANPALRRSLSLDAQKFAQDWSAPAMAAKMAHFYQQLRHQHASTRDTQAAIDLV